MLSKNISSLGLGRLCFQSIHPMSYSGDIVELLGCHLILVNSVLFTGQFISPARLVLRSTLCWLLHTDCKVSSINCPIWRCQFVGFANCEFPARTLRTWQTSKRICRTGKSWTALLTGFNLWNWVSLWLLYVEYTFLRSNVPIKCVIMSMYSNVLLF